MVRSGANLAKKLGLQIGLGTGIAKPKMTPVFLSGVTAGMWSPSLSWEHRRTMSGVWRTVMGLDLCMLRWNYL